MAGARAHCVALTRSCAAAAPPLLTATAAPQALSAAFIGTSALVLIGVLVALRVLARAAAEALFVTYIFPEGCNVRALRCAERSRLQPAAAGAHARADCWPSPPLALRQSYDRVCSWLTSRAEVQASSAVVQFYKPPGRQAADLADASGEAGVARAAGGLLLSSGSEFCRRTLLRARPLPGASVLLRFAGARVLVSRRAPAAKSDRNSSQRFGRSWDDIYGSHQESSRKRTRIVEADKPGRSSSWQNDGGEREEAAPSGSAVHLTMRRAHGPRVLAAVLAAGEAAAAASGDGPGRSALLHWTAREQGGRWRWEGLDVRVVPLCELVGLQAQAAALVADGTRFLASDRWYAARGIPYRRGYLLHGPSGCGKTALALALAAELELAGVKSCDLSAPSMTDAGLEALFRATSARTAVLLRRVDRVFDEHGQPRPGAPPGLSFSALLNVCDGLHASRDGAMVFFTSERDHTQLDAALARPGRMDVRCAVPPPDAAACAAFFRGFYEGHPLHATPRDEATQLTDAFRAALERKLQADARAGAPPVTMRALVSYVTTREPRAAVDDVQQLGLDAFQLAERAAAGKAADESALC